MQVKRAETLHGLRAKQRAASEKLKELEMAGDEARDQAWGNRG
ncbi:MAG: hypothetical protein RRB22_11930 [Gammaproteobacteria bacterium]|nr:hypothetical protein [Gammaproteobacteria bacterium]